MRVKRQGTRLLRYVSSKVRFLLAQTFARAEVETREERKAGANVK